MSMNLKCVKQPKKCNGFQGVKKRKIHRKHQWNILRVMSLKSLFEARRFLFYKVRIMLIPKVIMIINRAGGSIYFLTLVFASHLEASPRSKWDAFWICVPFRFPFVLEMGRAFLFIPESARLFPYIGFRVPFGGFVAVKMGCVLDLRPVSVSFCP